MSISVVTRTKGEVGLDHLILPILAATPPVEELIVVDSSSNPEDFLADSRLRVLRRPLNRFMARLEGIREARADHILLLDADQIPGPGLLRELQFLDVDAAVIPERSLGESMIGTLLDRGRTYLENVVTKFPRPEVPIIPRYYSREVLARACDGLRQVAEGPGLAHEDSILFLEALPWIRRYGLTQAAILNRDPSLGTLLRKAYLYGQYARLATKSPELPQRYKTLIMRLNANIFLFDPKQGFNWGSVVQMMRVPPYIAGMIMAKQLSGN
jgi:glycosyltransferase involved in cell wall biosynthesis